MSRLVRFWCLLFLIHGWLNLSTEGDGDRGPLVLHGPGNFTRGRQHGMESRRIPQRELLKWVDLAQRSIKPRVKLSDRCRVSCRVETLAHLNQRRRKENAEPLKPESQPRDRQTAHPFCQPENELKFGNFLPELLALSFVSIVSRGDIWLEGPAESSRHPWNE